MKKQNIRLARELKAHGLVVVNAIGHGARIVDTSGHCVAKVHLQTDTDTRQALKLLRRRGYLTEENQ